MKLKDFAVMYAIILMAVLLPIGSTILLLRKKHKLLDEDFNGSYGSLYSNLKTYEKSNVANLYWTPTQMIKKLLIAMVTVFVASLSWLQIILFQVIQLASLIYMANYMPMNSRSLNMIELINEYFVLVCSQYLILFTDFVPSADIRYQFGAIFMYILLAVIGVDCVIILLSMISKVARRAHLFYKAWALRK